MAITAFVVVAALVMLRGSGKPLQSTANAPKAAPEQNAPDPWGLSETVEPADLVKELSDPIPANRPTVVYVGPRFLYDGGHILGASFHGPGSREDGIADLRKWAQGLPRAANVVLYCGCCPLERCPNLRPAFVAMHDMGFTHLRVLLLTHNFATDWAAKGYPVEKGK
ncbi:MAG: rhodanese-like domain-containing protein [Candidatus Acidiferrales bacterium]